MKKAILTLLALAWSLWAPPCFSAAFSDVPPTHWAAPAVERCVAEGWFQGRSEAYFGVDEPMTRGAMAAVLSRFFSWTPAGAYYPIFSDVPRDAWYEPALRACYEQGAIPRQTGAFRPEEPLTRQELAAMLVRSLRLGTVAGLAEADPLPFLDLHASRGHIAAACALGLLNGVEADRFSPDGQATRGQVAAVLLRLEQKRSLPLTETVALIEPQESWPDLPAGVTAVAMAGVLSGGQSVRLSVNGDANTLTEGRRRTQAAGNPVLLGVTGSSGVLSAGASAASPIVSAVRAGGYDGLYLDLRQDLQDLPRLTVLVQALRNLLGQKRLYLVLEGPLRGQEADFAPLAAAADRLVVRLAAQTDFDASVPVSAMETPERLYDALRLLLLQVPADKLCLQLTARPASVRGQRVSSLVGGEVERLIAAGAVVHYSDRYACAYLQNKESTVWYLNDRGLAQRRVMLGCFGVSSVCLTSLQGTVSLSGLTGAAA